jgi:hypothetical protein
MITLNGIIENENKLTDRMKLDLGDNYMLCVDLLSFIQSINSFAPGFEIALNFSIQMYSDLHLALLNTIRRHTIVSNFLIRHTLESLTMFVYTLENKGEEKYIKKRDGEEIIDFDNYIQNKAVKYIETAYPDFSKKIEAFKGITNIFYTHPNIYSTKYNIKKGENGVLALIFDNYYDGYIFQSLLGINEIVCLILELFLLLNEKYKFFITDEKFISIYNEYIIRHKKNKKDIFEKFKDKKEYPIIERMLERLDKKYEK